MYSLFTDGSAVTNPNRGGFGYILVNPNGEETIGQGYENHCGTNRMELLAVVQGLRNLDCPSEVTVYTDSLFVINGSRVYNKPCKDKIDLWVELKELLRQHSVSFVKVGSGNPHPMHKRAHNLARESAFHAYTNERETCS